MAMDRTHESLSDAEDIQLLSDQEPRRYHTTEFQETDHATTATSVNRTRGIDTERSSGEIEQFVHVSFPQTVSQSARLLHIYVEGGL